MIVWDTPDFMDLPSRLRWMRTNARPRPLTQIQLSQLLGQSQTYVSERENGKRKCNPDEIAEGAEQCGYASASVFLTWGEPSEMVEFAELLQEADPDTLGAVFRLLRSLPHLPDQTRQAVFAVMDAFASSAE